MLPVYKNNLVGNAAEEDVADVLILGAGISGLACAASLRSTGLRVIVLEARQRIGGRLHTIPLGGQPGLPAYPVDLGGGWVHGIGNSTSPNKLYSLACELGLDCRPTDYTDAAVYDADGVRLADSAVADIESLYQAFEQHLHSLLHSTDPHLSLRPIQAALDDFATARRLSPSRRALLSFAVSNHIEHYWAGEARSMGIAALEEEVLPGGDVVLARGYEGMVRRLSEGLDVRLGHEILSVQYGGGGTPRGPAAAVDIGLGAGVTLTARVAGAPSAASAATAVRNGSVYGGGGALGLENHGSSSNRLVRLAARAAVVTLPLGVLRSGSVAFSPPLGRTDPAKAAAIGRLGTAVYNKVVLLYDPADVFWDDVMFLYRIAAPHEDGLWSFFLNLHKATGAPILVAFNLGEAAAALEAISDEATVASALRALAGMYGTDRVRKPLQAVVTRWGSDPHSRMSYTYIPAGLTAAAFDDLARPVLGSLFFAGEATHRRAYGTAHGAYDSGLRAALAVVQELQQRQQLALRYRQLVPAAGGPWSVDRGAVQQQRKARRRPPLLRSAAAGTPPEWAAAAAGAGPLQQGGANGTPGWVPCVMNLGGHPAVLPSPSSMVTAAIVPSPVVPAGSSGGGGGGSVLGTGTAGPAGSRGPTIARVPTGGFPTSDQSVGKDVGLELGLLGRSPGRSADQQSSGLDGLQQFSHESGDAGLSVLVQQPGAKTGMKVELGVPEKEWEQERKGALVVDPPAVIVDGKESAAGAAGGGQAAAAVTTAAAAAGDKPAPERQQVEVAAVHISKL